MSIACWTRLAALNAGDVQHMAWLHLSYSSKDAICMITMQLNLPHGHIRAVLAWKLPRWCKLIPGRITDPRPDRSVPPFSMLVRRPKSIRLTTELPSSDATVTPPQANNHTSSAQPQLESLFYLVFLTSTESRRTHTHDLPIPP